MDPKTLKFPSQQTLLLPLLEALNENGRMRARDACQAVAEKVGLPPELRNVEVSYDCGVHTTNLFERKVRWTRQNAVLAGLIPKGPRGVWELAEQGRKGLTMAKPGVVVCVARSDDGAILWAEAMSAVGYIEQGSVSAIVTSPPYPVCRARCYTSWHPDSWLETALTHFDAFRPLLTPGGSMVVNLADVYFAGLPALNLYQERLVLAMHERGWNLCGKHVWCSPSKPAATDYVTKQRTRVTNGFETFFWWSPTAHPQADNRNVLQPYSDRQIKRVAAGGEQRHDDKMGPRMSHPGLRYRKDNKGSIPKNFTVCGPEGPYSSYIRRCKQAGLLPHPARMPDKPVEHFVSLLTRPHETVFDPFGGSLKVAEVCKRLNRRYLSSEKWLEAIRGGLFRLDDGVENYTGMLTAETIT